jgi:hypothetical protein
MKVFLLFLVFLLIGIAIIISYQYWNPQHLPIGYTKPAITTQFSLNKAPSESVVGTIASMSGTVNWLSRTAAKPVQIKTPRAIQQGEELSTGSKGTAVITIQNDAALALEPNTHVSIVQLLPQNFVFGQDKGIVQYANNFQVPVSIRSLDLLTLLVKGKVTSTVDPVNQKVTISVVSGAVREAYEDSQNNSVTLTVNPGQTFVFDDTNKTGNIQ